MNLYEYYKNMLYFIMYEPTEFVWHKVVKYTYYKIIKTDLAALLKPLIPTTK